MTNRIVGFEAQRELFKECVYHLLARRIHTPQFGLLNRARFNVVYGGYVFILDTNNEHLTRDAWKAAVNLIPKVAK